MSAYDTLKASLRTLFNVPCPPGNTGDQAADGIANAVNAYHVSEPVAFSGSGTVNSGWIEQREVQLAVGGVYLVTLWIVGPNIDVVGSFIVQATPDSNLNISASQLVLGIFNATGSVYVRAQDGTANWVGYNPVSLQKMIMYFNNGGPYAATFWYSVKKWNAIP